MAWKVGQLGRFKSENPNTPRFEVVGVKKEDRSVQVWYNLSKKPITIPVDTFKKDCVNWWEIVSSKDQIEIPSWVKKGAVFQIEDFYHSTCVQWLQPRTIGFAPFSQEESYFREQIQKILGLTDFQIGMTVFKVKEPSFKKQTLQVRSVYLNYTSCLVQGTGTLLLVPLQVIASTGVRRITAWSRLEENLFEEEE